MRSQLLVIAAEPTVHSSALEDDEFFDGLDPAHQDKLFPLARLSGKELGLDVAWVPIVYHETWGLTLELQPRGDRFLVGVSRELSETEESADLTREQIRKAPGLRLVPFDAEGGHGWDPFQRASRAVSDADRAWRSELSKRYLTPVVGHAGYEPLWVQAHAARGARGTFVAQVNATEFGLCDVSVYVFWDAATGTFVQVDQMT